MVGVFRHRGEFFEGVSDISEVRLGTERFGRGPDEEARPEIHHHRQPGAEQHRSFAPWHRAKTSTPDQELATRMAKLVALKMKWNAIASPSDRRRQ